MAAVQPESLLEYVLIEYRWLLVVTTLMPLSFAWKIWLTARNYVVFRMNSAPKAHDRKVKEIQRQIKEWLAGDRSTQLCTARPAWQAMCFRQGIYKKYFTNIHINLVDVLEVDKENMASTVSVTTFDSDSVASAGTLIPEESADLSIALSDLFPSTSVNQSFPDFDLKTLLETSPTGKSILNFYTTNNKLDTKRKNRLTDIIIRHLFTFIINKRLTYDDYNILTGKIITLFPKECPGTYFTRPVRKSLSGSGKSIAARGKLVDKVRNFLFQSNETKRGAELENNPAKKQKTNDILFSIHEDDIEWLNNNTEPWSEIKSKWKKTAQIRHELEYTDVHDFITKWKVLQIPAGAELINDDFAILYPDKINRFRECWKIFMQNLIQLKKEEINSDEHKKDLLISINSNDTEDTLPTELTLLVNVAPPKGRVSKTGKFSTQECLDSIMIIVETVRCEPLVTMGQLSRTLAAFGLAPAVVPELDQLTVGGLVMGTGVETSSHVHGLFQHICLQYELLLADGTIIICNEVMNPGLFYAIPWSYGTLGFLTAVLLKVVPVKKYVRLEYHPFTSLPDVSNRFREESLKTEPHQFVEALLFTKDTGVVMTGDMVEELGGDGKFNPIGKWYSEWFFKQVEKYLTRYKNGDKQKAVEYIPLRDYYHRHTRSFFWELQDIIPFGNHPIFRYLFGWLMPPEVSLLKLTQPKAVTNLYNKAHVIQDMLVPIETLEEAVQTFHKEFEVYPIWLCPFKLFNNPGQLQIQDKSKKWQMFVDIGVYGAPKAKGFETESSTRRIEKFVTEKHGFQMLYADTYTTREEFRTMFDHTLYDKLRENLPHCKEAFPEIYGKVNRNVRK